MGGKHSLKMSAPYPTVWEQQCLEDIFTKNGLINQLVTSGCRTAQATLGLLLQKQNMADQVQI